MSSDRQTPLPLGNPRTKFLWQGAVKAWNTGINPRVWVVISTAISVYNAAWGVI